MFVETKVTFIQDVKNLLIKDNMIAVFFKDSDIIPAVVSELQALQNCLKHLVKFDPDFEFFVNNKEATIKLISSSVLNTLHILLIADIIDKSTFENLSEAENVSTTIKFKYSN